MRRLRLPALLAVAAAIAVPSCTTSPYTGRRQLLLLDEATERAIGSQAWQEQLAQERNLTDDPAYSLPVRRIVRRLADEVERGWDRVAPPRFAWEVAVVDSPGTANAWALPGGKIAVYTGLFPICGDENGLAVVLGHEIMHAVLRHGNERVSQGMVAGIGTEVLAAAIGGENARRKEQLHGALGLGASVGFLLPYSRLAETEADELGLILAARAGYDPRAGLALWQRMEEQAPGEGPPEFLSTHPSYGTRIENMRRWMPKAVETYERSRKQPVGALPPPGQARPAERAPVAGGRLARGEATTARFREALGVQFGFRVRAPVYIDTVRVVGPQGVDMTVEGRTGVPEGQDRGVALARKDGAMPAGRYALIFRGAADGAPWTETLEYTLR